MIVVCRFRILQVLQVLQISRAKLKTEKRACGRHIGYETMEHKPQQTQSADEKERMADGINDLRKYIGGSPGHESVLLVVWMQFLTIDVGCLVLPSGNDALGDGSGGEYQAERRKCGQSERADRAVQGWFVQQNSIRAFLNLNMDYVWRQELVRRERSRNAELKRILGSDLKDLELLEEKKIRR